jgi:hypothetical protein
LTKREEFLVGVRRSLNRHVENIEQLEMLLFLQRHAPVSGVPQRSRALLT